MARGDRSTPSKWAPPETPITGIATTFMATFDVLQRAAASRKNLVITHAAHVL